MINFANVLKKQVLLPSQKLQLRAIDWLLATISLVVLSIYLFYTIDFVYFSPIPGIEIDAGDSGWHVTDSAHSEIKVDNIILQIDELTYQAYLDNRLFVPFENMFPRQNGISNIEFWANCYFYHARTFLAGLFKTVPVFSMVSSFLVVRHSRFIMASTTR